MNGFAYWAIPFYEPTPPIEEQILEFTSEDTIMAYYPYRTNYSEANIPHQTRLSVLNGVHYGIDNYLTLLTLT